MHACAGPDGRRVELVAARWRHIVDGHPELASYLEDVLNAVAEPTRRMPGRVVGEERFYVKGAGPSRWLKVVVHYDRDAGRIVTAFARRSMP